jgi:hypothetical protein
MRQLKKRIATSNPQNKTRPTLAREIWEPIERSARRASIIMFGYLDFREPESHRAREMAGRLACRSPALDWEKPCSENLFASLDSIKAAGADRGIGSR